MTEFKVGDEIRCIKSYTDCYGRESFLVKEGDLFTIIKEDDYSYYMNLYMGEENAWRKDIINDYFELVNRKISLGDKFKSYLSAGKKLFRR